MKTPYCNDCMNKIIYKNESGDLLRIECQAFIIRREIIKRYGKGLFSRKIYQKLKLVGGKATKCPQCLQAEERIGSSK
jgi:hypothetical protein